MIRQVKLAKRSREKCSSPWSLSIVRQVRLTYNFPDKHLSGVTSGGYSDSIVVDKKFVLHVPNNLDLAGVAPLLCAGITTYSPLRHWGVTKERRLVLWVLADSAIWV